MSFLTTGATSVWSAVKLHQVLSHNSYNQMYCIALAYSSSHKRDFKTLFFSFLSIIRKCLFLRRNIPASKPTSAFKWNFLEDGILGPLQFVRLENDSLWSNFKKATDGFQDWLILLETRAFVESNLFYITLSNNFLTNFNANSFILKVLSCYSVVIENK